MLEHNHCKNEVTSPFMYTNYVIYFELRYAQNMTKWEDLCTFNRHVVLYCACKPNTVWIFHTENDHVFSFFLRDPIIPLEGEDVIIYDPNMPLYLLRVPEYKALGIVPRIVDKIDKEYLAFRYVWWAKIIYIGNVSLCTNMARMMENINDIDIMEQFGTRNNRELIYKRIEVYQLY